MRKISLLILMMLLPLMASADESGYCDLTGNVVWHYNESNYTLTISGNGAMEDYYYREYDYSGAPWSWFDIRIVVIKNGVTHIGARAFFDCKSLTSVTIPESVTSIAEDAFYGCFNISSVYITDLAKWCNIEFELPSSNPVSNAQHLYVNSIEIKDLVIPNSVTTINDYAFNSFGGLTSVTISNNVIDIGNSAFRQCDGIVSVILGDGVTNIGECAFFYCHALASVTFGKNISSIGEAAFMGCTELTSIKIPSSVTSIRERAFMECTGLTSVHITNLSKWCNIEFAQTGGNYYSNPLTYAHHLYLDGDEVVDLRIPDGVTKISEGSFVRCLGLTSLTISNSVTSIGKDAFSWCDGITSVTIGNGMMSIGENAFNYCKKLKDVYCYAHKRPETGWNVFGGYHRYAILHVMPTFINVYKEYESSNIWRDFKEIVPIGDANGDNTTNAADIVEVVNSILGNQSDGFNIDAADANGDGVVNAADIVAIVNIIMGN